MSTINANNAVETSALSAKTAQSKQVAKETEDRFMTLLVTQLQNQDPLNPMDNSQVTSQMAQLSTVNGINQLNSTLEAIAGQIDLSQALSAGQFVGKEVLVPGSKIALGSGADGKKVATPFGVDLMTSAKSVTVTVMDPAGKPVRTYELKDQPAGILSFDWDGTTADGVVLADGAYALEVKAIGADDAPVSAHALTYGKVGSVAYTADGLKLDLGLAGQVPVTDLRKILS